MSNHYKIGSPIISFLHIDYQLNLITQISIHVTANDGKSLLSLLGSGHSSCQTRVEEIREFASVLLDVLGSVFVQDLKVEKSYAILYSVWTEASLKFANLKVFEGK